MAFDKPTRNTLAKMVAACRERLTADISDQLQSTFGLYPDGTRLDVARTEADKRATAELRALLDYFIASDASSAKNPQNAYQRLVREIGFTTLNRLAALRLSEERGLVIECVRRGMDSDGFRLFDRVANGALGTRYATYRAFIEGMYDELALELPALFDRHHPHSHVFPGETALNETLMLLNDPDLARREIWKQDETIGWIYQYYNDPTERKKMRDESQAPRNSRELAVRNQFFTPRYVVEFLTDNTLGRIWFEMCGGNTTLAEMCRYLVKNSPGARAKKDPRDLKVLDPACGSGHFLLYAFDLLLRIYEEAWADANLPHSEETGTLLREDYPDLESLQRAAPELILRHNLHGIDIDPRAAQIAALALWLRAQRAYMDLRLKPDERPAIQKTNIVTAEPMPGDPALLEDFLSTVEVPFIQKLVREVFDKMTLAGEAGSLLKIEEEIRDSIVAAKQAWLKRPKTEQISLWQEEKQPQAEQLALFEGITDESFWESAEQRVLDSLQEYARHVENGKGTRRRLFVEDAERGFAFIDVSRKRYDVVLMNPPFGAFSQLSKSYIGTTYPNSANDIFATFIESFLSRLIDNGFLGAITSRTGFFIASFADWRREVLRKQSHLLCFADLGSGVMDNATVEAAAYILKSSPQKDIDKTTPFFRVLVQEEKQKFIAEAIEEVRQGNKQVSGVYWADCDKFELLPDSPFVYWVKPETIEKLAQRPTFEPSVAQVRKGLRTGDNFRFLRALWEINETDFTSNISAKDSVSAREKSGWVPLVLGGSSQPWFSPLLVVLNWKKNGQELRQYVTKYGTVSRLIQAEDFYFKPGMSWTLRAARFIPYAIPAGCIPTGSRPMAYPHENMEFSALAISSSRISSAFMRFYGDWFARPKFLEGKLKLVPSPEISASLNNHLNSLVQKESEARRKIYQGHEPFWEFVKPFSLTQDDNAKSITVDWSSLLGSEIEQEIEKSYELTEDESKNLYQDLDEALIARSTLSNSDDDEEEEGESLVLDVSRRSGYESIISYIVGCLLGRWDFRFALNDSLVPKLSSLFAPLPRCPLGMLISVDGLPATSDKIVSEAWLQPRTDTISFPTLGGTIKKPTVEFKGKTYPATIPDEEYPVKIAWDGILVDDPGLDGRTPHPSDIVRRVRDVLEVLWKVNHSEIEAEACEILGVKDLRDYFRKPSGFFADHLKRYSKSRRQAPIYLPLSTPSGSYTLWIYYHRLSDEILFTAVNRYVDPKIEQVERRVNTLQAELGQLSGKSATETRDQLDELREFLTELRQFREELLRIANLPYKPDLNDGVILNAAPFHRLFRLNKWAKDTGSVWKKLEAGEYDWAHIAYVLYPDRVRDVCKQDKSIAIAHGLESLYEGKEEVKKRKKKAKKGEDEQDEMEIE